MDSVIRVKNPQGDYNIKIKAGVLDNLGNEIRPLTKALRAAVVTDSNVAPLYLKRALESLKAAGFQVYSFTFTAGEAYKNLETVTKMLEFFCLSKLTRGDIAVAIGGGVTGDMVGFASAIYLRGIDFVGIPTSLLSQVDSSVGGKTGCDLPFGKNLCGAFHSPLAVFIDPDTLKTLPEKYINDGLSEAIKAGAIKDNQLFCTFEKGIGDSFLEIIYKSVLMKAGVVERDFTEKGERTLLNFGHTLGHAIEKYENFSGHSHGEAVSIGMCLITRASEALGKTKPGTAKRLEDCLKKYNLPTDTNIPLAKLIPICLGDKKSLGQSIKLVLIRDIGDAFTEEIPWSRLYSFFGLEA